MYLFELHWVKAGLLPIRATLHWKEHVPPQANRKVNEFWLLGEAGLEVMVSWGGVRSKRRRKEGNRKSKQTWSKTRTSLHEILKWHFSFTWLGFCAFHIGNIYLVDVSQFPFTVSGHVASLNFTALPFNYTIQVWINTILISPTSELLCKFPGIVTLSF